MKRINRKNQQLIAHCFFADGQVKYDNYSKYYQNKDTYEDITENS